jgi:tubulin polyglutamylase TTLL9
LIGSNNFTPGYDVIIDQDLKPWLLEVNASPSLSANTKEDYMMKTEMLHGMLDVVDMEVGRCFLPIC